MDVSNQKQKIDRMNMYANKCIHKRMMYIYIYVCIFKYTNAQILMCTHAAHTFSYNLDADVQITCTYSCNIYICIHAMYVLYIHSSNSGCCILHHAPCNDEWTHCCCNERTVVFRPLTQMQLDVSKSGTKKTFSKETKI